MDTFFSRTVRLSSSLVSSLDASNSAADRMAEALDSRLDDFTTRTEFLFFRACNGVNTGQGMVFLKAIERDKTGYLF